MENKIPYIKVLYVVVCLLCINNLHAQDLINTIGGTLSAQRDNDNANEASDKVIDGNIESKFLLFDSDPLWIQYELATPEAADRYSLTSGNDAPGRDPRDWTFEGSTNGISWVPLDTQNGFTFSARGQTKVFNIENTTAYKYYRLNITSNNGSGLFQLAEWRILKTMSPASPSGLSAYATAGNEIYLTWTDNSNDPASSENNFILERSVNGVDFETLVTLPSNTQDYLDSDLQINATYHYRVKAQNTTESGYSAVTNATTLNYTGHFTDITDNGGSITSSARIAEQDLESQGLDKLIDNNASTKMFLRNPSTDDPDPWSFPVWYAYESVINVPLLVTKYLITSGNDAADRDPKDWTLEASVDGENWDVLDTRVDVEFPSRSYTETFVVSGATANPYSHFRLHVSANGGSSDFQFAELQIWGVPVEAPAVPTNLDVADSTYHDITLSWEDNATNETAYSIERSPDGVNFEVIGTTGANATTYTDGGLDSFTEYYYRLQSVNDGSLSMYSNIVSTKTKVNPFIPFPPDNVTATVAGDNMITLVWEDQSTIETGFQLERSLDGVEFIVLDSLPADVENYEDTGLIKATTYYYRLLAYNELGQSEEPSNVASATTTGVNNAPLFNLIEDEIICSVNTRYRLKVSGISAGTDEEYQTLRFRLTSDTPELFDELFIEATSTDTTFISFTAATDTIETAEVTLTIIDDGGAENGGSDTYSQTFTMITDKSIITASANTANPVERGATIELTASGGVSYTWLEGPGILSEPNNQSIKVKPTQDYPYTVEAISPLGCVKTNKVVIKMDGDYNLKPNNILTPNNDGYNDVWVVWNINTFPENEVRIYDTSGRIVFNENGYANTWDGKAGGSLLPTGVYYYVIELGSGIPSLTGSLTIIN